MTKIMIATPAFDGKVHVQYALSLAETELLLAMNGIKTEHRVVTTGSLLCAERNRLLKAFMSSDCTHILCIDSDLGWPPNAVINMIKKDEDFIGGCYPARKDKIFMFRPCVEENGAIKVKREKELLKMEYIPAGFMLIKRHVIEKMMADHPETKFVPKDPNQPDGYALFNTEVFEGEFWGEDYVFCRRVKESGFDIWVDPMIQFDHAGVIGMLVECLSDKPPEQKEG
jgi:hypothetical protein